MTTNVARIAEELILTDALTGNDEGTPTHYTVHADDLEYLVAQVLLLAADDLGSETELVTEWRTNSGGITHGCRSEDHARGMLNSTSPVLGPQKGRRVQRRAARFGRWEDA